jgi:quinol monooxygenase YgiN
MITRIVKLELDETKLSEFLEHFEKVKWEVANFPGCFGMKLLRDKNDDCVIFTYSQWKNNESLNNYRESELFKTLWPTIKPWFRKKAEAWSVLEYFDGFSK